MKDTAHHEQAAIERPSLYVVATPIGNLADITLRALDVLKRVDAIAAEDTRITLRLLRHYGIDTPLIALHEHNERRAAQKILQLLAQGKSVALVADAGTPAISDPGAVAVAAVRDAGYAVVPVPGANAAVACCCRPRAGSATSATMPRCSGPTCWRLSMARRPRGAGRAPSTCRPLATTCCAMPHPPSGRRSRR